MKPFLGIDLTVDKTNEQLNGAPFLTAQPSPALTQAMERSMEKAEHTIDSSRLPLPLRIVQWVCGGAGLLIAASIIKALPEVTIQEAYANASVLFWIAGICLPVWLILKLLSMRKEKAVLGLEENAGVLTGLESVQKAVYTELNVPADAAESDLLSFYYKEKNGTIKPVEKGMQLTPYVNPIFRVYADVNNLYIANLEGKYAFPLSEITAIRTVKKHIRISGWNKDEACSKGIYKPYKLSRDNYGCIHCKHYHILEINRDGEIWGVYFPNYELPVFEALTGHRAQQT